MACETTSSGQLKPDVVLQLWAEQAAQVPDLSRDYIPVYVSGFTWYVRRASEHVLWSKLPVRNFSPALASK